jgi:hypothetical protein
VDTSLEELRAKYETWEFSTRWFAAASAADKCMFVAERESVRLTGWTVTDLEYQVSTAQRMMGR